MPGEGQEQSQPSATKGSVMSIIKRFAKDQSGATAIEYGLIAVGIAITIIAVVRGVGGSLNTAFTNVNSNLQ